MRSLLKKISCGLLALVAAVLCGCDQLVYIPDYVDEEKDSKIMEEKLTQLFHAVEQKDEKAFDSFFADHVLPIADFDVGRKHVFDLYKGDLIEVNFYAGGSSGEHVGPGERIYYAHMVFLVTTTEAEYEVVTEFYTKYISKNPEDPYTYKIRDFALIEKDDESFQNGFSRRYGIYYPDWLSVENVEGSESKLNARLSVVYSKYDKAEILKYFHVKNGDEYIDTFCIIDTGERLDLRNVITFDGGATLDVDAWVEDLQARQDYSVNSYVGDCKISFYVSDKQLKGSDYIQVIKYSHNDIDYWLGIKPIDYFD